MMKRVHNRGNWAIVGRYGLAVLVALSLLLFFLFLLVHPPTLAQPVRTANQAALEVNQTVGTAVGICAPTSVIAATASTNVHYCVTIRNTGPTALVTHTLSSSFDPGKPTTFIQTVEPGAPFNVTSNVLNELLADGTLLSHLVPANPVGTIITHTVIVTSTNAQGDIAIGQAVARVVIGSTGLKITKTVGLNANCVDARKIIAVAVNTPVRYCVAIQNTGTLTLTRHQLVDPLLNVNRIADSSNDNNLIVSPGETIRIADITENGTFVVTDNVTNTITVTSSTLHGINVSAQDQAVAMIGQARIVVTDTLALDAATCGSASSIAVVTGRNVYHCLRIKNEGTVPLETHEIRSTTVPVVNAVITQTLQPGQSLVLTTTRVAQLVQTSSVTTTSNFTVTSRSLQGIVAIDTAQARIAIGTQTFTVIKYATTDPNGCVTTPPLSIASNQAFYYCIVLTNTGTVPLARYTFAEGAPLNISGAFTYPLTQNQRITITKQFLANTLKLPTRLGPFTASASFPGSLTVNAFSAEGMAVAQVASFQVNISAPAPTATPSSTPFPTFTPTISPTPSLTPFIPPTPTATPILLSYPATPVQPFDINSVTTPTPIIGAGGVPPVLDAFGQPMSPLDPALTVDVQSTVFALTVEAAATQTAWAFTQPPVVDTPMPPPAVPLMESPLESPLPTATLFDGIATAPSVALLSPLATPVLLDTYVDVFTQVFQASTATLSWIWFLGGSIIFFATAGMFFGLSWLRRRAPQAGADVGAYYDDNGETGLPDTLAAPASPTQPANANAANRPDDEDFWPASLR